MGLFDFLKAGKRPGNEVLKLPGSRPECDITKTQVMVDLFKVRGENRNEEWTQLFLENVKTASFSCGDPQVFTGPDGFPYFALNTPQPGIAFESFCLNNMKDDFLLEKGYGVVINPKENSADWVFSYGDIVNLHINKELSTKIDTVILQNEETIKKDEKVLLAQPSESYLPNVARQKLKHFLQSAGVKKPKLMMVCRTIEGKIIQELAFNIFPEDFASKDELNYRLMQVSWFLPKHYIILSLPKKSGFTSNFVDL